MKKLVLGLDVGIASVGWGLIDYETNNIVDCGVRLFPERNKKDNADRRNHRSTRRLIRRRVHRLERLKELLIKNNIIDANFETMDNPYEIRCKGLHEKLNGDELATAILHIAKRRGVTGEWTVQEDTKTAKDDEKSKGTLNKNSVELANKYICELQVERLNNDNKIRGIDNIFTTEQYVKELKKILSNQDLPSELENQIIEIIVDRREYYEGPGNEKSISEYGRFYFDENGKLCEGSMIDKMRGKCSIYPNELRASKQSYSACLFNLLNELNNMNINGEPIDTETKKYIIDEYINKKGGITVEQLKKVLELDTFENSGCRINEKGDPIITDFTMFKKIKNKVDKEELDKNIYEDKELFDDIASILSSYKGIDDRKKKLSERYHFNEKELEYLSNLAGFTGFHNLSLKAIREFIDELIETNLNHMQIMKERNLLIPDCGYKGLKNIPVDAENITSPVAKRSHLEAIKVVNAVRKKYGELDSIVIEMAREKNSEEQKNNIKKLQSQNKEKHDAVEELLDGKNVNSQTKLKVQLYLEQDGKTAYNLLPIDLNDLINNPLKYEIDHVIPISVSFNDSLNNKVLVTREENQIKGKRTPYEYFKSGDAKITYDIYKASVMNNKKYTGVYGYNKRGNLLFEGDINSISVQKRFIQRNLVDTRYATRNILNTIQDYFSDNNIGTKIYTINGKITHIFRKKAGLEKDRDLDSSHHAVDALIISGIKKMNFINALFDVKLDNDIRYSSSTGEIITLENEADFFDEKYMEFIGNLRNSIKPKFSYKIDSKVNKKLSDETIYGTINIDGIDYTISKYKNIYDKSGIDVAKKFREGKENKLLSYYNDNGENSVHNQLKKVVNEYPASENPFADYFKEHGYIRKPSKKGNGPIIKDIRYIDKMGESVIYLDNKYNLKENVHVIKKQLVPYRNDIYKSPDGFYKQLLIYQYDIENKKGKFFISKEHYDKLKEKNDITNEDEFVMSLYKESIIGVDNIIVRYAGKMNSSMICYKMIGDKKVFKANGEEDKQPYLNIKNAKNLLKYNVDILGNMYVANDTCKLEIDMV